MSKSMPESGRVLYRDNHIMAVLTNLRRPSENIKTGDLLQLWIICSDKDPLTSRKLGLDKHVCGSCPLSGNGCYVLLHQAPTQVYRRYKDKPVQPIPKQLRASVRLGAFGDIAFLPVALVNALTGTGKHTSYTHQWNEPWAPDMSRHSMASIDNVSANRLGITSRELKQIAQSKGYRTYRTLADASDVLDSDEILCPNFQTGIQCAQCLLCNGNATGNRKNIAVPAHGVSRSLLQ